MDTGVAIILGSIVVASSILYIIGAKGKISRRDATFFVAGIATVALAGSALYIYKEKVSERPQRQTSFIEVPLRAKTDELVFLKGAPSDKLSNVCWRYYIEGPTVGKGKPSYLVKFESDKVVSVEYSASEPEIFERSVLGFGLGDVYENVVDAIQAKSIVRNSPDGLERIVAFPDLQAFFRFRKGRVTGFGIFSESSKEPSIDLCVQAYVK